MMEGRSFWPIAQRVKQGRQLKKDSVNDSNVNDGLRNVTEGVLPSLPPVDSQDTAYEPKSKVTDCYAMRAPGRTRSNIKEGGIILEVPMDDDDDYFSETGPERVKQGRQLKKDSINDSNFNDGGRVFASHKATTKHES